ncbi:pilus assembly FimT family protein [Solidesulfovibrio sp.]
MGSTGFGRRCFRCTARGFTMIEAVVVLLLLGIIAVYAVSRTEDHQFKAVAEADALRAALRYAQSRAMADIYTWGISLNAGGYQLVEDNPGVSGATLPGQGGASHTMPSGVTLGGAGLILFDWRGQPVTGNITAIGGTAAAASAYQNITVTASTATETVVVTPYTGFIP